MMNTSRCSKGANKSLEPTPEHACCLLLKSSAGVGSRLCVCAGHGTELVRCKSSHQVFAEPKARRRASS